MLINVKPCQSHIIKFPEDIDYYVLTLDIQSKLKWFKRKSFFMDIFDSYSDAEYFNTNGDFDNIYSKNSYYHTLKYDENKVIYIFNPNDSEIEVTVNLQAYSKYEYEHRNDFPIQMVTGI